LVIDDDAVVTGLIHRILSTTGCLVESVETGQDALKAAKGFEGVIVLDIRLPDIDGPTVFKKLKALAPTCPVIFLTGHGSMDLALDAMQDGAFEFIDKTTLIARLPAAVEEAFRTINAAGDPGSSQGFGHIVTQSREMGVLFRTLRNAIESTVPVLIHGESGTGKELIARAIHEQSASARGPFIAINCAGIPEPLLEAELFGYERGAFTGAVSRRIGKFEAAHGGTLLLDEIGEMHPMLQAKLLRVLQEGELQRLGGNQTIKTECRVVSATNRDLEQEIEDGRFRADLILSPCRLQRVRAAPARQVGRYRIVGRALRKALLPARGEEGAKAGRQGTAAAPCVRLPRQCARAGERAVVRGGLQSWGAADDRRHAAQLSEVGVSLSRPHRRRQRGGSGRR